MARVEITKHLFAFFPQLEGKELLVDATTVAGVIEAMEAMAKGFAFYICDERGRLRRHVNIFVDEQMIGDRRGLSDPVESTSRVLIMQALSGG
ncbi:MAG TPA: MoaD/ThiS family protein [Kofleriaceae bacterium]|nr:MoaD/ThiS family protein [Kofleriaceae bacterium]